MEHIPFIFSEDGCSPSLVFVATTYNIRRVMVLFSELPIHVMIWEAEGKPKNLNCNMDGQIFRAFKRAFSALIMSKSK